MKHDTLDFDAARTIYGAINHSRFEDLRRDLLESAIRYAGLRVQWLQMDGEARADMDGRRSRAHEAFIDQCNILARNMAACGEDASWREVLGQHRKSIGDFACFVHLFLGIAAR
ncbi:MAG TPA: hypothetical protein VM008_06135 [Phycisphaerae bacterium]|nr:hypothetical protein [Phycisphaerae bacterium]